MSDSKSIINQVMSDEKLIKSRTFRDRIYKDEPILRTAVQLKKSETPYMIRQMKEIAYTQEACWKTSAWLFFQQAAFMADYEDDYAFNDELQKNYFSYRDLTNEQLRGYFSWRTLVRKGNITKAPTIFVFLHIYELLNCIGGESPEDCLKKLRSISEHYRSADERISRLTDTWSLDFIVYHGLDSSLADGLADVEYDKNLLTLIHWTDHTEDELFGAVSALSAYQPKKSLFYLEFPDDFKTVLVRSFVKLSDFFRDNRKKSLCDRLFGVISESTYHMFSSALFYDKDSMRSREYFLNEIHSFSCSNYRWSCRKYCGNRGRNTRLGEFVKAVDCIMREHRNFRHKISLSDISKSTVKLIRTETELFYEECRRREAAKIEIDLSKLGGIRKAADITREKLLVDDESEPEIIIQEAAPDESADGDFPLDSDETAFIRSLLYGGNALDTARNCGKMASILADSANEKLFDVFGDTVIDYSADEPMLIEDYIDELKSMITEK